MLKHYQNKWKNIQKEKNLHYFVVKIYDAKGHTISKRFTLYTEAKSLACADFKAKNFNSYGLLQTNTG